MSNDTSAANIEVRDASFTYNGGSGGLWILDGFSLALKMGEVTALMGESGCGKSTLAKLIARIDSPKSGEIRWPQTIVQPHELAYVDQVAADGYFPWYTVSRNLAYPLKHLGWSSTEIDARVSKLMALFRIGHLADTSPALTSGGEQQRVATARAFAAQPRCLILDESFSALDAELKSNILQQLRPLSIEEEITLILITHNVSDALALADRCVMLEGPPLKVIADERIDLPFPRNETMPSYHEAKMRLFRLREAAL